MKKHLLMMALLCLGSLAIAQKTETATKEYTQRIPKTLSDEGIFGIAVPCTETYHYYYDDNDNRIKHGLSTTTGAYNFTRNGVTIDEKFSGTANYANGKLNGNVQQSYYITLKGKGESINISWNFSGGYVDGIANGVWTYKETRKIDQKGKKESENDTFTVVFKNGKVSSITYSDGVKNTVDENGKVTGKWGGFQLKDNIVTDHYRRKNGDVSAVEAEHVNLINGLIDGNYSIQDIIDQGYNLNSKDVEMLDYFCSRVGNSNYVDLEFLGGYFVPQINNRISILEKVNLATFEDVKAAITRDGGKEISMNDYNNINKNGTIYINGTTCYLSSETRKKVDVYVEQIMSVKRNEIILGVNKVIDDSDTKELLQQKFRDYESSMGLLEEVQKEELRSKYQTKLDRLEQKDFDLLMGEIKGNFISDVTCFPRFDYLHRTNNFANEEKRELLYEAIEKQPLAIGASRTLRKALDQIVLVSEKRKITKEPVETIASDFSSNASNWEVFVGETTNLPEKIAPFCPMGSYSIVSTAEYLKDGSFSYIVEWTKMISKKESVKYSSVFVVSKDKKHVSLESFDFSKATEK